MTEQGDDTNLGSYSQSVQEEADDIKKKFQLNEK